MSYMHKNNKKYSKASLFYGNFKEMCRKGYHSFTQCICTAMAVYNTVLYNLGVS